MHVIGLHIGSDDTAWIGRRHCKRLFRLLLYFFESCISVPICTSMAKKRTSNNLKSPKICPMIFEGTLILNLPIEFPHFAILLYIEGGSNATSIEDKHLN